MNKQSEDKAKKTGTINKSTTVDKPNKGKVELTEEELKAVSGGKATYKGWIEIL